MKIVDLALKRLGIALAADVASAWPSSDHLTQHTLDDLYGISRDLVITRDRAMTLPVVSKGRRAIAGTIGRMRLRTYKGTRLAPIQPSLLQQPERGRTLANSLTWLADALIFYPRTWWIVEERDSYGWPRWVKHLPQGDAREDKDGRLTHAWGKPVEARDVIQFDAIDAGFLHDARTTIQRAIAINLAAAHAEDNPVPSVDLHNEGDDIDDDKIKVLVERWVTARKTHGVGFSSKGLKVNTLGIHPEQLLIDGRKVQDANLARHIGAPAWAVDIAVEGGSLNYTNRASRNWELIDLACSPYMTAIVSRLSLGDVTPNGWDVRFDADELTRDDIKTRFETYRIGLGKGGVPGVDGVVVGSEPAFITQDQINQWEGWDTPA